MVKMKSKKKGKSNNLKPAFYFGLLIFFIILVSVTFKVFELFGSSKYDGANRFTVAIIKADVIDVISVSPKEKSLTKIEINKTNPDTLAELGIPIDQKAETSSGFYSGAESYFAKMLSKKRSFETDLTIIDLIRLGFYSAGIDRDKIIEKKFSVNDKEAKEAVSSLLKDPVVESEKVSIQIINATDTSGLGNRLAKLITNLGGSVVLVNSSKDINKNSKIIYKNNSYTAQKLSKILNINLEKGNVSSISDIIIIIGEDKSDLSEF